MWMIKELNFKFGILQAKRDSEQLHRLIIRVLWVLFWFMIAQTNRHSTTFKTGSNKLTNMLTQM